MPRGRKTDHGEVINTRVIKKLRHEAQIESWAHRFAAHQIRLGWAEHAACRGTATDAWFDQDRSRRRELFPFCESCPVRLDCGTEAMVTEERHTAMVHGARAGFGPFDRYKAGQIFDKLRASA